MANETEDHESLYCFPAVNSSCIKSFEYSRHEYIIMHVVFSLLSAWTVFLNLVVIISISHFKKLHTPTNLIILSLAVADMLIGLIVIPIQATTQIEAGCWYFGETFCSLYIIVFGLLSTASLSSLVLIAVDRYVAVCYPLHYPQKITTTKTLISICLSWVFAFSYGLSVVIVFKYFNINSSTPDVCYGDCTFSGGIPFFIADALITFIFPCTISLTLYLRIFYVVLQHVKVINSLMNGGKCVTEGSLKRKSESKATLILGIIVVVYMLGYVPYYTCYLWVNSATASTIVTWMWYINPSLDPLIYAIFYPWFKKTVKLILTLKIFQPASSLVDIFTE